jgi:hypothetical protein
MKVHNLGKLVDLQSFMSSFVTKLVNEPFNSQLRLQNDQFVAIVEKVNSYHQILLELELPVSALNAQRVLSSLNSASDEAGTTNHILSGQNRDNLIGALKTICDIVGQELETKLVLIMPNDKVRFFQQNEHLFSQDVLNKFPNNIDDLVESGNCFALGRYTACVFHLMRVMEVGVQKFGDKLGVSLVTAMGKDKMWHNLLEEANKVIKQLSNSSTTNQQSKVYAGIAANLYNVKLAWRNEVMHPKATYSEDEAESVFIASKAFLTELALVL